MTDITLANEMPIVGLALRLPFTREHAFSTAARCSVAIASAALPPSASIQAEQESTKSLNLLSFDAELLVP
jgi:hypothetical protein